MTCTLPSYRQKSVKKGLVTKILSGALVGLETFESDLYCMSVYLAMSRANTDFGSRWFSLNVEESKSCDVRLCVCLSAHPSPLEDVKVI